MTRPRLRTLLLLSNLVILALPLAGLWFLRLYESALIRQTESELISQAAVLAATFKSERHRLLDSGFPAEPVIDAAPGAHRLAADAAPAPGLDLATDSVLSPPPDPAPASGEAGPLALAAGAAVTPILRDVQRLTLAAIRILDRQGRIVATTGDDGGLSLAGQEEVERALHGELASVMRTRDHPARASPLSRGADLRVFVAMPVIDDGDVVGAVLLSRTPRDVVQAMYGKRFHLAALAALLLAVGTLLAIVGSRLVTRPLDKVVAQARRVAAGAVGAVDPIDGLIVREAAELSAAVARMAATLEQRAGYIRNFAAHVSHEFKTPLAAARGAVELLDEHFAIMSSNERARFLAMISGSIARLDRLVGQLLELARADMMPRKGGASTALAPALERLTERYAEHRLAVALRVGAEHVPLPEEAVDIVFGCLLDNVLRHGGAQPHVTIDATTGAGGTVITFADDGPGIAESDRSRVFEPFFTTARESGGTGLGLSIVRAIVAGGGGTIELLPTSVGTAFRLAFPTR